MSATSSPHDLGTLRATNDAIIVELSATPDDPLELTTPTNRVNRTFRLQAVGADAYYSFVGPVTGVIPVESRIPLEADTLIDIGLMAEADTRFWVGSGSASTQVIVRVGWRGNI